MAFWDKIVKSQETLNEDYYASQTSIQSEESIEIEKTEIEMKEEEDNEPISINPIEVSSESLLSNLTIKGTNLKIETKDSLYLSNCTIEGDISTEQNITIDGGTINGNIVGNSVVLQNGAIIKGNINKSSIVTIENGKINGEVIANEVIVNSYVKGSIKAKIVELKTAAIIDGDVFTEDLAVDRGATVSGNIKVTIPKKSGMKLDPMSNEKQQTGVISEKSTEKTNQIVVDSSDEINLDKDLVN